MLVPQARVRSVLVQQRSSVLVQQRSTRHTYM
jgi:hypothetical protein